MSNELMHELEEVKDLVNKELLRLRRENIFPKELYDAAFHLPLSGGKRLRPFLLIKSAQIFSEEVECVFPVAVAVELLHNFTLIHDDIMDQDEMRRNVKTTHVLWGVPVAMTAGDALFSLLFKYVANELSKRRVDERKIVKVIESLADGAIKICEGQVMDLLAEKYIDSEEAYFNMVSKKTSTLFRISSQLGGLLGGASEDQVNLLGGYGENLGIAFQIIDDVLGLIGDPRVTGKPVGNDLREGKRTIIILHALRNSDEKQREAILNGLGRREISTNELNKVISVLKDLGSIEYAKEVAKKYAENSIKYLRKLPENRHRRILEELAKFTYVREL